MSSVVFFTVTVTCCLLFTKQWVSGNALQKPTLKIITDDPQSITMMGDTITLKCIRGSENANKFYLLHKKTNEQNETQEGNSEEFRFPNIKNETDGEYSCKYCDHDICSEFSSPLNILVRDKFPRPLINANPRRVVQPGAALTITCSTHLLNNKFTLLKDDAIINQSSEGGNQFSYVINAAKYENTGYYSCMYERKSGSAGPLESVRSNSMKITVLGLPAPSMTCEEDPNDSRKFRINCTAPDKYKQNELFFSLLNGSKLIEDEVRVKEKSVTFTVDKPQHITMKYLCMYQIRLDFDYADSLYSTEKHLWEDLPKPSIHLEPHSAKSKMKIHCIAPREYNEIRFQLLNGTHVIAEHKVNDSKSTVFTVNTSEDRKDKISCIYRIKMHCGFVDSRLSEYLSETYTLMFIRHILSALVLILIGIFILIHFREFRKAEEYIPPLPVARARFNKESDYSEVVWKSGSEEEK